MENPAVRMVIMMDNAMIGEVQITSQVIAGLQSKSMKQTSEIGRLNTEILQHKKRINDLMKELQTVRSTVVYSDSQLKEKLSVTELVNQGLTKDLGSVRAKYADLLANHQRAAVNAKREADWAERMKVLLLHIADMVTVGPSFAALREKILDTALPGSLRINEDSGQFKEGDRITINEPIVNRNLIPDESFSVWGPGWFTALPLTEQKRILAARIEKARIILGNKGAAGVQEALRVLREE